MEGHKKKNPFGEAVKAASLAAGLSALPIIENPAEAQSQKVERFEEDKENRAERMRESKGTVKEYEIVQKDLSFPNQRYPGKHTELKLEIVLDDEGVVNLTGIDVAENFTLPIEKGDRVKIKYKVAKDLGVHAMSQIYLDELETIDGKVIKYRDIYYSGPSNWEIGK